MSDVVKMDWTNENITSVVQSISEKISMDYNECMTQLSKVVGYTEGRDIIDQMVRIGKEKIMSRVNRLLESK